MSSLSLSLYCPLNVALFCRVKPEILKTVGKAISSLPENFKPHRAVKKVYEQRAQMIETGEGIDWALAEALAFATLVVEGNHVRLSGQDVERGTFSHRHSVLHDQETGEEYCPLDHLVMNQDPEMFTVSNRYFSFSSVIVMPKSCCKRCAKTVCVVVMQFSFRVWGPWVRVGLLNGKPQLVGAMGSSVWRLCQWSSGDI